MRIGIDARFYGLIGKGIGRYLEKLIANLEKIDQENEYIIFLRQENFDLYEPKNPNFKKVLINIPWYGLKEQICLPFKIHRHHCDIVHFPNYNLSLISLIFKIGVGKKFFITIHDLIPHQTNITGTTKNSLIFKIKLFFLLLIIKLSAKKSEKVFTVSEFSKKEIIKLYKIKPEKIIVTYEAAEDKPSNMDQKSQILEKLKIEKPYLLYVGNAYPHKNLERLIEAYKIILPQTDLKLVLVGRIDYFYSGIKKMVYDLKIEDKVIFTDMIDDNDLNELYQNALVYVFPSLMEGFGLPGLEAMRRGLPVISSNIGSLTEIYGSAAQYFNPYDTKEIAEIILKITKDQNLIEDLKKRGFEQVKKYSWVKCAEETLKIYNSWQNTPSEARG